MRQIAEIQLENVSELLSKRNISLALTQEAKDLLIQEGYDPVYGARPLKRVLQRRVIDPLASRVIQGEIRDGDHVLVDAAGDEFNFVVTEPSEIEEPLKT